MCIFNMSPIQHVKIELSHNFKSERANMLDELVIEYMITSLGYKKMFLNMSLDRIFYRFLSCLLHLDYVSASYWNLFILIKMNL